MTIYDLSQALKRYWIPVTIAFSVLIFIVFAMTFTIADGKPGFRSGVQYESSVQIAVVNRNLDSLITSDATPSELEGNANLYAQLLGSDEAAKWIGDANGFRLDEAVSASVDRDATVISATVIGPTPEQATGAALSTFAWLNRKLLEPVVIADFPSPPTTLPTIDLDGAFTSFLNVGISEDVAPDPEGLFLTVEVDGLPIVALPMTEAGVTRVRATLKRIMTVILIVSDSSDQEIDRLRFGPEPAPLQVQVPPELNIALADGALRTVTVDDEQTLAFAPDNIEAAWSNGLASSDPQIEETDEISLALLTTEPGFTTSGGRRGPILAFVALVVGTLLILAAVIVADTWRTQSAAAGRTSGGEPSKQAPARGAKATKGAGKAAPAASKRSTQAASGGTQATQTATQKSGKQQRSEQPAPDLEIRTTKAE